MGSSPDGPSASSLAQGACPCTVPARALSCPSPPGSSEEAPGRGSGPWDTQALSTARVQASTKPPASGPNSRPLLTSCPLHVTTLGQAAWSPD